MQRNIMLSNGTPIYCDGYGCTFGENDVLPFDTAMNLIWDISKPINIAKIKLDTADVVKEDNQIAFSIEEWQKMGYDAFSIFEDPMFKDSLNGDFSLSENSPAYDIGFKPIDVSAVGPRS
jgi:hypothetical protein